MSIIIIIIVTQALALPSIYGYYIKPKAEDSKDLENQWNFYQQKLGLSTGSVELLKSQQDQPNIMDILNRLIGENNKYTLMNPKKRNRQKLNDIYLNIYRSFIESMNLSKHMLNKSLNEIIDNDEISTKDFKRSRRKIPVKMVPDMPTERIDELLKLLNRQHSIDSSDSNKIRDELEANYDEIDYDSVQIPTDLNADYLYENLYEDDQDSTTSSKPNSNGEFKSFQDLIIHATQLQWNNNIR